MCNSVFLCFLCVFVPLLDTYSHHIPYCNTHRFIHSSSTSQCAPSPPPSPRQVAGRMIRCKRRNDMMAQSPSPRSFTSTVSKQTTKKSRTAAAAAVAAAAAAASAAANATANTTAAGEPAAESTRRFSSRRSLEQVAAYNGEDLGGLLSRTCDLTIRNGLCLQCP